MKAMDDSTLEREIEGLLSVDAAPDFRARLRQRLAQEPPLRASRPLWHLMPAVAASALIAAATVLVMVLRGGTPAPQTPVLETRPIGRFVYGTPVPSVAAPSVAPIVVRAAASTPRRGSAAVVRPQMEVVIHAPEVAAWRRLLADVHSGDVALPRLTAAVETSTTEAATEFMLAPIVIEPLTPELQGVHP
jgi:hypothetical protein